MIRSARRLVLLFTMAGAMVLFFSAIAFAQIIIGTDNGEPLVGTNFADHITGKGGNDTLRGKAGNDVYHFDDGFGQDTLTETAFVRVGDKRLPGGTDTLSFSQCACNGMQIFMVPEWGAPGTNDVHMSTIVVDLGTSPVERAVGGSDSDLIVGGSAKNTYKGGPGGNDTFVDYGGNQGSLGTPTLPPSSDTYKGFTSGAGFDEVRDYGGTADKLDLRPLESSDVYFDAVDLDFNASNGNESLRIVISDTTRVDVRGHFSPSLQGQENGRMEQIIFSDEIVT